jgi:hypothetical protein
MIAQYASTVVMSAVVIVGAVGMIRIRGWGAICVTVTQGLDLAAGLVLLAAERINFAPTLGSRVVYFSFLLSSLSALALAFLPFAIWRVCRKHGVFGVLAA